MTAEEKVFKYIDERFEYARLEKVPALPGGTMVIFTDESTLIVSYDFAKNEIVEHLKGGERRVPWFVVSGDDPGGYYPAGVFEEKK